MASTLSTYSMSLMIILISVLSVVRVQCVELDVGGDNGWVTPSPKNQQLFNDWASNNRFKVNDTLRFKYVKDSVLVVTQEEYEKCRSSHPMFFSNNGDTLFTLDRSGLFYFISGVSGHCERGLKMIVKVLEPIPSPDQTAKQTASSSSAPTALTTLAASGFIQITVLLLVATIFM